MLRVGLWLPVSCVVRVLIPVAFAVGVVGVLIAVVPLISVHLDVWFVFYISL